MLVRSQSEQSVRIAMDNERYIFIVIVGTAFALSMIAIVGFLMIVNTNRRHRYRADLAEADLRREGEVMLAEREATEQTLNEIGRELHDNVGQLLTVAQMGFLDRLENELPSDPRVAAAMGALEQGIDEVRRLGRSLNNDLWQERHLMDALEAEAVRVERLGRARVLLTVEGDPDDPPPAVKVILFRTFQEVLNNALKHSMASTIVITLGGSRLPTLHISDNGHGFDPKTIKNGGGLVNIRRRCALINYEATLETGNGTGCTWKFTPLSDGKA